MVTSTAKYKTEQLQILKGLRDWAVKAAGWLGKHSITTLGFLAVGIIIIVLGAVAVAVLACAPVLCLVGFIIVGLIAIVATLFDALVDLFNSIWDAIKNARAESKRKEAIYKQAQNQAPETVQKQGAI